MIDRYLLRYLLAVVDRGNFTRAAAHCGVTQPTLSTGIARLEAELGKAVFVRSARRVELTGAGARLVEHARRIEREFTLAEQESRGVPAPSRLRLGIVSTLPADRIAAALRRAAAAAPDERLEVIEAPERALLAHLDRGRLDVLLTVLRPARHRFAEPVFEEGYRLVLPADHALAARDAIAAGEVASSAMIVRRHCEALPDTSRHFVAHGVRPFMSARTTSDDQALAYVRAGLGLTVIPACFARAGVAFVPLAGFDLRRTIGFAHGRPATERRPSPVLDAIRASLSGA
jgi:LysR family transcriptional regulator, hydrogen peroxide-inducible genes activator